MTEQDNSTDVFWLHHLSTIRARNNVRITDNIPLPMIHQLRNGVVLNVKLYEGDGLDYLLSKNVSWEDIIYGRYQDKLKNLSTKPDEAGYILNTFTPHVYVKSKNQFIIFINVESKYCRTINPMGGCLLAFKLTNVDSIAYYLQIYGVVVEIGTIYRTNNTKIIWESVSLDK